MSELLEYSQAEGLLTSFGVPVVPGAVIWTLGEARTWAGAQGFPVCLKINSVEVAHRSDIGGVILNIRSPQELTDAYHSLIDRTDLSTDGLVLQKMLPAGIELIVGVSQDATFGPVLALGAGGILAELIGQVAIRPVPLTRADAFSMMDEVDGRGLLDGFRSFPAVDREALADLLVAVSRTVSEHPWIRELDLNPVMATSKGLFAADLLVVRDPAPAIRTPAKLRFPPETMRPFFDPASIAVIGASRNPGKGGHVIVKNLRNLGFPGEVAPINPNTENILGYRCYPDLTAVPFEVESAVVIVPQAQMTAAIDSCVAKGVKVVTVVTAGYSDTGAEGAREEEKIRKVLNGAGIRLMGPNSIGTISPARGLATSITTLERLRPGKVAICGQTGVFASGLANHVASAESYGLSRVACIGNRADVDECDVLEFLLDDDETEVIGLYLEGIGDGARFAELLARAQGRKPLVVVKAGRSEHGVKALSSHTGSLAVDDRVFDGICNKYNVMRAVDLEQLLDVVKFLALVPPRHVRTLGGLSISGMGCVLTADLAGSHGFELPAFSSTTTRRIRKVMPTWAPLNNPCDLWSTIELMGAEAAYREVGSAILADEAIDALFLVFLLIEESLFKPESMLEQLKREAEGKPIFAAILGGERSVVQGWQAAFEGYGIPTYSGIQRATTAAALALGT